VEHSCFIAAHSMQILRADDFGELFSRLYVTYTIFWKVKIIGDDTVCRLCMSQQFYLDFRRGASQNLFFHKFTFSQFFVSL
jgi:hypothetical protein